MSVAKNLIKSRYKESVKSCVSSDSSKLQHKSGNSGSIVENRNFDLHKKLQNTLEGFIHQLDELFLSLRAEEHQNSNEYIPEFTSYQDICEKLRIEVLIAIDKLKISTVTGASYNENNIEFLQKMDNLKYQLSDIRCQYHNAIKDFDFSLEDDTK